MLRRLLPLFAVAMAALSFAPISVANPASAGATGATVEARDVRAWLMRIHDAAGHRNFQGTFVVSAGGAVSSSRIAHFCVGTSQFERIESLDGQLRNVFRHNDVVHTVWPKSRVALVEQRTLVSAFPALLQAGEDRIVDFYEVRLQGAERIAGREADVLLLRPKDKLRYGYRLWADRETGLLLRVEVLGERDEVLESSAFSDVTIGIKAQPDSVLLPMKKLDGYRVVRPTLTPIRLDAEGWKLRQAVPGFEQVSCVMRPLGGVAEDDRDATTQVLQSIYSDGLSYVSVFIEPYDPARHPPRGMHTTIGATQTLMHRLGDWWLTVVGDVPAATVRQFANAMEYKK
jgi:sigma-E factor negative regulatory protein RseB